MAPTRSTVHMHGRPAGTNAVKDPVLAPVPTLTPTRSAPSLKLHNGTKRVHFPRATAGLPPLAEIASAPKVKPQRVGPPAFRSTLLLLESELSAATSSMKADFGPTPERAAACFSVLRGLLAVVSEPFRPLLDALTHELFAAVYYDPEGGGSPYSAKPYFEEAERLRTFAHKQQQNHKWFREEASRLGAEKEALVAELEHLELLSASRPAPAPSREAGDRVAGGEGDAVGGVGGGDGGGGGFARVVGEVTGRNVYDRVLDYGRALQSKAQEAKEAVAAEKARAAEKRRGRETKAASAELDLLGGGRPASQLAPDELEDEVGRLRSELARAVARPQYDQLRAQLVDAQSRLVSALSALSRTRPP